MHRLIILRNTAFAEGIYKVSVSTQDVGSLLKQLNRYVPSAFSVVFVWPVRGRHVFNKIRETYRNASDAIYLRNGFFQVNQKDAWFEYLYSFCCDEPEAPPTEKKAIVSTNCCEPIMTRTDAARQLSLSPRTLSRWEHKGLVNVPKTPSGRPAYTPTLVRSLISDDSE